MENQGYILITLLYLFTISLGLISFLFSTNQDRYSNIKIKQKIIENQLELKNKVISELNNYENFPNKTNFIYLTQKTEDQLAFSEYQLILINKNNRFFPKPDYAYLLKTGIDKDHPMGGSLSISTSINFKNNLSLNELKILASENTIITLFVLGDLEIKNEFWISSAKNSGLQIIVAGNIKIKKITNQTSKNSSLLIYSAKGKIEIEKQDLNLCVNKNLSSDNNSQLIAHEIKLGNKQYSQKILGCPLKRELTCWPNYLIIGEKN